MGIRIFLFFACLVSYSLSFGQGIKTILMEGAPAIDGNGVFGHPFTGSTFDKVVINESGQIAFTGRLKDTAVAFNEAQGLYLYEPESDEVIQIARAGKEAPGNVGNFFSFSAGSIGSSNAYLSLNDAGQIAMFASTLGDAAIDGPFLFSRESIINIARVDGADPRELGVYQTFATIGLANNGQVAWWSRIEIGPNDIPGGFFMTDPADNSVKTVLMHGDAIPDTSDVVHSADFRGINNVGTAVLFGDDTDGDDGEQGSQDVWSATKDGFERLVNDDGLVPGGTAVFDRMSFADINDNNEIVFSGRLRESADGPVINTGVFLIDEEGVHLLGHDGVNAVNGEPLEIFLTPKLNNQGQVAVQARLGNFGGIYLFTTDGGQLLLKQGDPVPGGSGSFVIGKSSTQAEMWLNDAGQVLFLGGGGYWVVDADGNLNPVVLIGQALEGGTVTEVDIVGVGQLDGLHLGYGNQRPMNNSGQVVFRAELADGRDGIFLWEGPPPPLPEPEIEAIFIDGNDVVVSLDTGVGASYQLRRRETLASGDWQNEGVAADGTGDNVELRHVGALPTDKQFYDVLMVSPDS